MVNQDAARTIFTAGDNAFADWLHRPKRASTWDEQSFDAFVHFFRSYCLYRDLPNVHLYHYCDMVRDLRGSSASMAATLGITVTDRQLDEFAAAASFHTMKGDAARFAPYQMSDTEIAEFAERAAEPLSAEAMDWLLNGRG